MTGRAVLTPLESAEGRSTYDAIRAGESLTDCGIIDDALLGITDPSIDRATRMAIIVARRAVHNAGWTSALCREESTWLFAGTSKGPVLSILAALDALRTGQPLSPSLAQQITLGPSAMAHAIAQDLVIGGGAHTSVAACSSGMHALHRAAKAIRHGECASALVVAADASVHPLFEGSFDRLGVLAKPDADGHRRCRPFDDAGAGFFLTEAAAAIVLEASDSSSAGLELEHTWIGGDASHLLAIDPATHALKKGLRQIPAGPLSFIHAHATGTTHDLHERDAIRQVLGELPMFSHKKWLGHSLGAAGLAGLVLSAECHAARCTLEGTELLAPARSITLSQGFGGHIGLAVLRG